MGCCDCGCINKLDHVEKVIAEYDPTEKFINYKLLTIWLNRKTRQAYILVSKKDGIAVWEPINLDINAIEKILLDCGEAAPNEKGEIRLKGECGVRAEAEGCENFYFDLFTADPLTGGKRVYLGDEVNLGFRADIAGDVRGPDSVTVGNVPVYKDTTGKTITTSNINSADGLTNITKSSKGEQKLLVETADTESGSNAGVEAKSTGSGTPYFQLTQGDNKWRRQINPETGALEIRPVDDLSKGSILSMLPNGVMLMPWQPKLGATFATAKLDQANVSRDIGGFGGTTFTTILDQEGYNLSAGNFYPGDGAGQGAFYTTTYDNAFYLVVMQFLVQKDDRNSSATTNIAIQYQGIPSYIFRKELISGIKFETFVGVTVLRGVKGNKISFSLASTNQNIEITNFGGGARENYIGVYMLG